MFESSQATVTDSYYGPLPGPPISFKAAYSLSLDFLKNGEFGFTETYEGKIISAKGTWDFTSGIGEKKSKVEIVINLKEVSTGSTNLHLFNKFRTEFKYQIRGLHNKELEIYSIIDLFKNSYGEKDEYSSDYILRKG